MRRTCAATLFVAAALLVMSPAAADPPGASVAYRAPVPGPVIDPYRPPSTPYGAGNRGIDFATTPGEDVRAPADGQVTFAGAVGGGLHVVILHADGIRTSLSFLASVLVRRGQRVVAGQPVGWAAATLHFGARRGEAYLDPATLLAGSPAGARAFLVPDGPGRPLGTDEEAAGLRRLLAGDRPAPLATVAAASARSSPSAPPAGNAAARLRAAAGVGAPPAGAALAAAAAVLRLRRGRHGAPRRRGGGPEPVVGPPG